MTKPKTHTNRLAQETSPYLRQHAHNPVDWYPWGPEALALAQKLNKPILLSIGYSACHWCHVMERESFEDHATAEDMNAGFVNIKVDREERPDLDEIYMQAVQAFSGGRGGWPMTVFLTPTGEPFFGGTYFPDQPRHGMPSFRQVMKHVLHIWNHQRQRVDEATRELIDYLGAASRLPRPAQEVSHDAVPRIARAVAADFDERHAGFGGAPKFPPHGTLAILLHQAATSSDARALSMATETLDAMALGGMYDLVGGGFARYSVDAEWRIPHFEKMLYDNAQLVPLYVDAWRATGHEHYRRIAQETCDQVIREMRLPDGGFASAFDADSDGHEGSFYVFSPADLTEALGAQDGPALARIGEITPDGTFERGTSVLRLPVDRTRLEPADNALIERALPRLRAWRDQREWPGRDDKVITAWNGLMIGALARAGAAFNNDAYLNAAEQAAEFILNRMVTAGRLQRIFKDGRVHIPAFADDYAALTLAMVELFEATTDPWWLQEANGLANQIIALFWDADDGGLFYTGHDAEVLVSRSKRMLGGAEPSANGLAALAFARLAAISGREDLGGYADEIIRRYEPLIARAPRALGPVAIAASWRSGRTQELAIIGDRDAPMTEALLQTARARHRPLLSIVVASPDELEETARWVPSLRGKAGGPSAVAYLCEGTSCRLPVRSPEALNAQLDGALSARPEARTQAVAAPALPDDPNLWLNTDQPIELEALRGRVVVLDFWTSGCLNCSHTADVLARIERKYHGKPVTVIGVHTPKFPAEHQTDVVARAVARDDRTHAIVVDPNRALWDAYGIQAWPTLVVVDPSGNIVLRRAGEPEPGPLTQVLDRLLGEEAAGGGVPQAGPRQQTQTVSAQEQLSRPGKVSVWPPAAMQEQGADPLSGDGRLYVADTGHHRILEFTLAVGEDGWPSAALSRVFGANGSGFRDGGSESAQFCRPNGLDRSGNELYVADTGNHAIRRIDLRSAEVTTLAGDGNLGALSIPSQSMRQTALRSPWAIAVAGIEHGASRPDEDMIFSAMAGSHQLWAFVPGADRFGPIAGEGHEDHIDGSAAESALAQPTGLCLFGRYLFFADSETSSIRFLDLQSRTVGTLVGAGLFDFGDTDGQGAEVRLQHPMGLTAGLGAVWVADTYNGKIKRIDLATSTTTTHVQGLTGPEGIARAGSHLVVADTGADRLLWVCMTTGETRPVEFSALPA